MTVKNLNDKTIFNQNNIIDSDESWALKLLKECEQEEIITVEQPETARYEGYKKIELYGI